MKVDITKLEKLEPRDRASQLYILLSKKEFPKIENAEKEAEKQAKKFEYSSFRLNGETQKVWVFMLYD